MKAIYCEICGDIVAPGMGVRAHKDCHCGMHRVWWEDPRTGQLRICYMAGHPALIHARSGAPGGEPEVWVLGISNSFLHHPSKESPTTEEINHMLERTPDSYIFKKTRSMIIRIRPSQSSDTAWAEWGTWVGARKPPE